MSAVVRNRRRGRTVAPSTLRSHGGHVVLRLARCHEVMTDACRSTLTDRLPLSPQPLRSAHASHTTDPEVP
jgi:hypothetical protein